MAAVVGPKIAKSASAMGPEFTEWLLVNIEEENLDEVYEELIKVDKVGNAALAHFADKSFWEKATAVVGVEIADSNGMRGTNSLVSKH